MAPIDKRDERRGRVELDDIPVGGGAGVSRVKRSTLVKFADLTEETELLGVLLMGLCNAGEPRIDSALPGVAISSLMLRVCLWPRAGPKAASKSLVEIVFSMLCGRRAGEGVLGRSTGGGSAGEETISPQSSSSSIIGNVAVRTTNDRGASPLGLGKDSTASGLDDEIDATGSLGRPSTACDLLCAKTCSDGAAENVVRPSRPPKSYGDTVSADEKADTNALLNDVEL